MNGYPAFLEGDSEPLFWIKAMLVRIGDWFRNPSEFLEDITEAVGDTLSATVASLRDTEATLINAAGNTLESAKEQIGSAGKKAELILDTVMDAAMDTTLSILGFFGIDAEEMFGEFGCANLYAGI